MVVMKLQVAGQSPMPVFITCSACIQISVHAYKYLSPPCANQEDPVAVPYVGVYRAIQDMLYG